MSINVKWYPHTKGEKKIIFTQVWYLYSRSQERVILIFSGEYEKPLTGQGEGGLGAWVYQLKELPLLKNQSAHNIYLKLTERFSLEMDNSPARFLLIKML